MFRAIIGTCLLIAGTSCRCVAAPPSDATGPSASRVRDGLQVLYDFATADGPLVLDRADVGEPLHLKLADPKAVRRSPGELEVVAATVIPSEKPADRVVQAVRKSGAITIEAWVRPATTDQRGPARVVTLSVNSGERNFTLGQDGERWEVRLRAKETSTNGMPATTSRERSLTRAWTHVVYARDRAGKARLYVDGRLNAERDVGGTLANWSAGFKLALANELSKDRPWLGSYRLVAVYSRALTAAEVLQNFRAGGGVPSGGDVLTQADPRATFFEMRVAPLLSRHCLECHDAATKQGGLDLSRKATALAGGDEGPVIAAGQAEHSRLWKRVAADEMPLDREPLSSDEKGVLRKWLSDGAAWSLAVIDPAVYAQGSGPGKVYVQRLTASEYIETVRSALGVDVSEEARAILPRDVRADGFSNTAYNLNVDLEHVEAYARLAERIVQRLDVQALARRHTKSRELTDENVTKVIEPVGRKLLRGPLSKEEITRYCGISTTVAGSGGDFEEALRYTFEALLQSPRFLYRIENQRDGGVLDSYAIASRVSYILWGGPPDDLLLEAAEKDRLDRGGLQQQVARMLKDRRTIDRSRQFLSDWLHLDHLDHLRPGPERFPQWDARLAGDMRAETLAFFEEIAWNQKRPLTDLLNAQETFLTPRLARHYGLPVKDGSKDDALTKYDLSKTPRHGGLLAHGSVLTVGGDDASMVTRGLFVMHELLRGVVRDPPPCVDTTPPRTKPGQSQRAISEVRLANTSCAGCHGKFEPLAFGLERFDGLGTYREIDEHGNRLREDGRVLFPGEGESRAFATSAELMDLLAGSERVRESFTWKLTQFALGRPLGAADAAAVADIHQTAWKNGGTYADLLTAIVLSDLVRKPVVEAEAE